MRSGKVTLDLIFPLEKGITKQFPVNTKTTLNDLNKFLKNGKSGLYEIFVDGKGTVSLNTSFLGESGTEKVREFLHADLQTPVFWRGAGESKTTRRKTFGLYRLTGGGGKFIDVSNDDARVTRQFGKAPPWRVVVPGLCLKSVCPTRTCAAYSDSITCKIGHGLYNPITMYGSCPMCSAKVQGKNMLFSQCVYRVRALKRGSFEDTKIPWTEVGYEYVTWNEKMAGIVDWDFMEVEARALDGCMPVPNNAETRRAPVAEECAMCFNEMRAVLATQSVRMLSCCHSFHSGCVQRWITESAERNVAACCPICRKNIE